VVCAVELVVVVSVGVVSVWVCPSVNSLNALEPPRAAADVAGVMTDASARMAQMHSGASARLDTWRAYRLPGTRHTPAQTVE
jgi:hypothetical protein